MTGIPHDSDLVSDSDLDGGDGGGSWARASGGAWG